MSEMVFIVRRYYIAARTAISSARTVEVPRSGQSGLAHQSVARRRHSSARREQALSVLDKLQDEKGIACKIYVLGLRARMQLARDEI